MVQAPRSGPRRALRRAVGYASLVAATVLALGWTALERRVVEGFREERWRYPVRVYGAATVIRPGTDVDALGLVAELDRQGYRLAPTTPLSEPGTYRRSPSEIELFVREAAQSDGGAPVPPRRARVLLDGSVVREIALAGSGERLGDLRLDPPLLEGTMAEHWVRRRALSLRQVPRHVVDAVLLAEDARFFEHPGVDLGGLLRALRINWRARELRQGGSTITQQLVKNLYLTPERTLRRKLIEIPMALSLERHASKEEILEAYLATVYLGHDRLVGIYGLAEAADAYFGKEVSDLSLGEASMLGGMIRAPNVYSPLRHPERALARRDQVINHLLRVGKITPSEAERARAEPAPPPRARSAAPESFLLQQVRRELERDLAQVALPPGSAVFTTLDPRIQRIAQEAIRDFDLGPAGPEIAVVALEPRSGAIRALVGGRDYLASQLDRATRARRSLGAMADPLLVLARAAEGAASGQRVGTSTGAADEVGYRLLATELSLTPPPAPAEAPEFSGSLLDLVSAYAMITAGGRRPVASALVAVQAPDRSLLLERDRHPSWVVDPAAAAVAHAALADGGETTSRPAPGDAGGQADAVVTAASRGRRDVWAVGYSPTLVLGVWSGFDDERPLESGAEERVVSVWTSIFERVHAGLPGSTSANPESPPTGAIGLLARGAGG